MKKLQQKLMTLFAVVFAVCLIWGGGIFLAQPTLSLAEGSPTAEVTGVQVRSNGAGTTEDFIVLLNENFVGKSGDLKGKYNTKEKVKIFMSPEDKTGKYLTEVCGDWMTVNYWSSGGLCIAVTDYTTHNGTTIYKIVVEAGCELPCSDTEKYVTTESVTFINKDFGKEDAKNMANNWDRFQNTEIAGIQVLNVGESEKYVVLQSPIYTDSVSGTITAGDYNTASKIKVYVSKDDAEGRILSELVGDSWKYNAVDGVNGLFLAYKDVADYGKYNGKTIYKIAIEAGCVLPCGTEKYITVEDVAYINQSYGEEAAVDKAADWEKEEKSEYTKITGIQILNVAETEKFVVLESPIYTENMAGTIVAADYNTTSKIKIYVSEDDTEGVILSELVGDSWKYNAVDGVNGLFLAYKDVADYATYNGKTIYKITIEAGCELPCGSEKYVVEKTATFINQSYGEEAAVDKASDWERERKEEEGAVTGVAVRKDDEKNGYIVLLNEKYGSLEPDTKVRPGSYNTLSKIKIFTSEDQTEGIALAEVCDSDGWTQNLWTSRGLMIPIKDYDTYNGKTIYKIAIEAGCELPYGDDTLYVTSDAVAYINTQHGRDVADGAFNWWNEANQLQDFGTTQLTTMDNRARTTDPAEERWLIFYFNQDFEIQQDAASWVELLNMLDYIDCYLSDDPNAEPVKLRDIYFNRATMKGFGQSPALNINIINSPEYDGPHMYKVIVRAGCQFPYVKDGKPGYVTVENDKIFVNRDYGKTGEIFGLYDETGAPRTYELWSVAWPSLRQVSFVVEGIEGLTYDPILIAAGEMLDAEDYAVDGYTLTMIDEEGNVGFDGGFMIPDDDIVITLSYTKNQVPEDSGCGSSGCGSIALFPSVLSVAGVCILMLKKRNRGGK